MHAQLRTLTRNGTVVMQQCGLYKHPTAILHDHHICPESWWQHANQPINTPMIKLCPTCHYNTHSAIDALLAGHDTTAIPTRAQRLARQALTIATQHGLTPTKTL